MNEQLLIVTLLVVLNASSFIIVGYDKHRSESHGDRVPEVWFFFLSTLLASVGVFLGMFFFRHKTRKFYFPLGIGLILLQQLALTLYFLNIIT